MFLFQFWKIMKFLCFWRGSEFYRIFNLFLAFLGYSQENCGYFYCILWNFYLNNLWGNSFNNFTNFWANQRIWSKSHGNVRLRIFFSCLTSAPINPKNAKQNLNFLSSAKSTSTQIFFFFHRQVWDTPNVHIPKRIETRFSAKCEGQWTSYTTSSRMVYWKHQTKETYRDK